MMPTEIEETLERSMRSVNDVGRFDAIQRAIVEVILHQALVDMHAKINVARMADCDDVDALSAALDAALARNNTLSATLGAAQVQIGLYESAAEDMRSDRHEHDLSISNLQDNVTRLIAELTEARTQIGAYQRAEKVQDDDIVNRGLVIGQLQDKVNQLTAELAAARQPIATTQTTVISTQPATNGTAPTITTTSRPSTRKMDKEELLGLTVAHIKALAKELGRTPTLIDFNETRERAGLPVWNSLTDRLERSWMSLVLAADLTPNKPGPRPEVKSAQADDDED